MIDSRVVDLKFNWSQFADGVRGVLSGVAQLTKGLQLNGASKGMADVSKTAAQVPASLNGIGSTVASIGGKFSAMQTVAVGALLQIGSTAVRQGAAMAKSFTVAPIMEGFREYELKLNSIQTILANTKASGATLNDVNGTLKELNRYSDQTIYNFGEMAKNIGTFTAAGVGLDTATASIKGIANLAALSGSNSQQASTAMYQLSQAISSGRVSLMDWNSVVNAGMGGTVFQRSLAETAVAMGKLPKSAVKLEGAMKNVKIEGKSFRDSISSDTGQPSWLTSDVLTTALGNFTGDMKEADLVAQGFSANQAKAIMDTAKTAKEAATVVKSGTQLMGTLKEASASGWSETFELIVGDFEEAKKLWTGVNNVFGGMIQASADARNKVIGDWKALGGREVLIQGIKNAFQGLMSVLKPVKEAFRQIFPAQTGAGLFALTEKFTAFTEKLKMGADTAERVKRIFAGVFAVFSIIGQIIGGAISAIGDLFGVLGKGSGGFLKAGADVGMFLVNLDLMLRKSGIVKAFFDGLADVLSIPLKLLAGLGGIIAGLFTGFDLGGAEKAKAAISEFGERMAPLEAGARKVEAFFKKLGKTLRGFGSKIGEALSGFGDHIAKAFGSDNFSRVLDVVNTGLLGGILLLIKNFMGEGASLDLTGGLFDSVKETLGQATSSMKAMQTQIKADVIIKIATALAILTASLLVLSLIDSGKLADALKAAAYGMGGLTVAMVAMTKMLDTGAVLKLPFVMAGVLGLAGALLIMAVALKVMASIPAGAMVKGLIGVGASLLIIAIAMRAMPKGMVLQAAAIGILAGALILLSFAIRSFASISWDEMAHGMGALAATLTILAIAMRLMPKNMAMQAAALLILSAALNAMAIALKVFATISWEEMGRGLAATAGMLVIIAAALRLMPANMLIQAVALNAVAVALNVMALAVKSMAEMSWAEIATGLVALGGSLLILAIGLNLMTGTIGGAAAMVIAAGALAILTPILITLGSLSMSTIVTGLLAIAGVFAVLGAAGFLLTPLVPTLLALAGVLVLMAGALLTVAGSALLFATAFTTVVSVGAAGVKVLGDILSTLIQSIPKALAAFGQGIVNLANAIGKGGAAFFRAFSTILQSILKAIITNAPLIARAMLTLLASLLRVVVNAVPMIAAAGLQLIVGFLRVIAANVPKIMPIAISIIVSFINGISNGMPRLVAAGVRLIITFINTLANTIRTQSGPLAAAGVNLATAIVEGMARGLASGAKTLATKAANMAKGALNAAKKALGIASPSKEFTKVGKFAVEGFAKGLTGDQAKIQSAYKSMGDQLIEGMRNADDRIKKEQERLDRLRGNTALKVRSAQDNLVKLKAAKKQDPAAIAKAQRALTEATSKDTKAMKESAAALAQAKRERHLLALGLKELHLKLNDEEKQLESLAIQRGKLTDQIKEQTKAVEDAIKTRDDFAKSLQDQFGNLPDVSKDTKLAKYMEDLQAKVIETRNFSTAIQKLRDLGLNDEAYKELLQKGPEALPFIAELLNSGKGGVSAINALAAQLQTNAADLGKKASISLYQAGVDSAQGLLDGLKSKESAIVKQMETLAGQMVAALKKKLGIRSPSREFQKLGDFAVKGLVKGLEGHGQVTRAANTVGDDALNALRASFGTLGDVISSDMQLNPVITPVLDLSGVRKEAGALSGLLSTKAISVDSAYAKAKDASKGYDANRSAVMEPEPPVQQVTQLNYTQNNNSPKALSEAEIYRGTKSQLSTVRGALKT